jgi:hypothetical protein
MGNCVVHHCDPQNEVVEAPTCSRWVPVLAGSQLQDDRQSQTSTRNRSLTLRLGRSSRTLPKAEDECEETAWDEEITCKNEFTVLQPCKACSVLLDAVINADASCWNLLTSSLVGRPYSHAGHASVPLDQMLSCLRPPTTSVFRSTVMNIGISNCKS